MITALIIVSKPTEILSTNVKTVKHAVRHCPSTRLLLGPTCSAGPKLI